MIPNDYFTALGAINKGEPISSISKRSDIAKSFANLAVLLYVALTPWPAERGWRAGGPPP